MNPVHDYSSGENAPETVNAVIEIEKGSSDKCEVNAATGNLELDRILSGKMHYPEDYGFIPRTLWFDNDPLDILVITDKTAGQLAVRKARVIGMFRMVDDHEKDDKIIAVYEDDNQSAEINDISDIPKEKIAEMEKFFDTYKKAQGRECKVIKALGRKAAYEDITLARKMYEDKKKAG